MPSPQIEQAAASVRTEQDVRSARLSMADVIQIGAAKRPFGMSDDQRDNEWGAQKRLIAAILEFRNAINMVNECSALVTIDRQRFEDFVHDDVPSITGWDEKIARASQP